MQTVYIAGAEPQSGKSLVALAFMELALGAGHRVGFFRPVVQAPGEDPLTGLMVARYGLDLPPEALYGVDGETARELATAGRMDELLARIVEAFERLRPRADFVVCCGTDFQSIAPMLEFEFNAEAALNLDALMVPVCNGAAHPPRRLVDVMQLAAESLAEKGCPVLAHVANRVPPAELEAVRAEAAAELGGETPVLAFPAEPLLGRPTVAEVARGVGARQVFGATTGEERLVADFKVAAMEVPNFLEYVDEGCLVLTPGDRADILLATLAANEAGTYPHVAGVILTGALEPPPSLRRLLDGLSVSQVPVFLAAGDTFTVAMDAARVRPVLHAGDERKLAAALGVIEAHFDHDRVRRRLAEPRRRRMTPARFEYLLASKARADRRHIVLPEGTDARILRAAEILTLRGVAELTLLGEEAAVRRRIRELGLALDTIPVIDPSTSPWRETFAATYHRLRAHKGVSEQMAYDTVADVSYFGTLMVHHGHADGMVSGAAHTTQHTIRPAFEIIKARPGVRIVSSVFFMCLPDRVLVYGDCAVVPRPTAEELADIAVRSAETAERFGIEPVVALLSYSTGTSGKGEEVERVRRATALARALRPDLPIDGPMQYDAAVDPGVGRLKAPDSPVAGRATVLVFPDLNTGNNTYKAVQRSAGAIAIGPVLQGLNKPVNDLSRGCTVPDVVNTVAITAVQAQRARPRG
jgi:phosphate acetyltransferase